MLVKTTKKHDIYCLSTPEGMKAIKATISDNLTIEVIKNLENKLKIGSQISYYAFRKSHETTMFQNRKATILEWADGVSLSEVKKLKINSFFNVAREITSCVLEIHKNKIRHLNLTSDHIILSLDSKSIKVIGCGSSSKFSGKLNYNPKLLERDLRYISPEQTGM